MSKQNIYTAMGSLAYAVAKADGEIQNEEVMVIRKIAQDILFAEDISNDIIDEIFDTLKNKQISVSDAYAYAIDVLEANKYDYDFYDSMKEKCVLFLESVAESFQGTSFKETELIENFKKALSKY